MDAARTNEETSPATLRQVREASGLSLRQLASLSGVSLSTVNRLELDGAGHGGKKRLAHVDVVRRLSLALDVNPFRVAELNEALMSRCGSGKDD